MKKLIMIAVAILALHQSNTQTINYIDNTAPVYYQSGNDHSGGTMVQSGTMYTSYDNKHRFVAGSALQYFEVYTRDEVVSGGFNPFDIAINSRMFEQGVQADANAQTFYNNLCTASTCTAGYGDQGSFGPAWNTGYFGNNTINTGVSNVPTYLYRQAADYLITSGAAAGYTIYKGALLNQIETSGSGWGPPMATTAVRFFYYNPLFFKNQNDINAMSLSAFLTLTQTDSGSVTLTKDPTVPASDQDMRYNSIFKTATDGTTYYTGCVFSTTYAALSTTGASTSRNIGSYVQDGVTYYVYGTILSSSTSNGVTKTPKQQYDSYQAQFSYITVTAA